MGERECWEMKKGDREKQNFIEWVKKLKRRQEDWENGNGETIRE